MDIREIRSIGKKQRKENEGFVPSPERIARMCAKFRAKRMPKPDVIQLDDDCDADLEGEADRACR